MMSVFRVYGVLVGHRCIYNQQELAFGLRRLIEVCERNNIDPGPVLKQTVVWVGSAPQDYKQLRSKAVLFRFWKFRRFFIQGKDTIAVLDSLAQLLYSELNMPVKPADIMRGISEHG